jgi:hypothetical protein
MVRNEEEGSNRDNRDTVIRKKERKKLGWRTAARKKCRTAANWSEIESKEPTGI